MDQPSNFIEGRYVGEQVDVQQEGQSDSFFCHGADSSWTESPGAYFFQWAGVLFQLR